MKKLTKIVAGALAAALTLSLGGMLMACGSGTAYTFEAEDATTEGNGTAADQTQAPASVENNVVWTEDGEGGAEVSGLGGFNTVGQKIIWKVTAAADCSVTITLHAASAQMDFDMATLTPVGLKEVDLGDTEIYALKVNDEAVTLSGKLPETPFENGWGSMQEPGVWWHMGTATAKANLKAGENTIVLEIVGGQSAGINVDKIVINSSAELS